MPKNWVGNILEQKDSLLFSPFYSIHALTSRHCFLVVLSLTLKSLRVIFMYLWFVSLTVLPLT